MSRNELIALLAVVAYVALLAKARWARRASWWVLCRICRLIVPERDRYRDPDKLDPRRSFSASQRAAIIKRDGDRCRCPGCKIHHGECQAIDGAPGVRLQCDHRYPHSRGGRTNLKNGQMLCGPCNLAKGAHVTDERTWAA